MIDRGICGQVFLHSPIQSGASMICVPDSTVEHLSAANFAYMTRVSADLRAACAALDGIEFSLSDGAAEMAEHAATIRVQARQVLASAGEVSALAASYETFAAVLAESQTALPAEELAVAKAKTKAKRRKA